MVWVLRPRLTLGLPQPMPLRHAVSMSECRTMSDRSHLAEMFHWSADAEVELADMASSAIGMAGPVAVGALMGDLHAGLIASIGALAVGGAAMGTSLAHQAQEFLKALAPVALATLAGAALAGHGWATVAGVVGISAVAGLAGGYSLAMVPASARFIIFLLMALNLATTVPHPLNLFGLIAAGAVWTALVSMILASAVRAHRGPRLAMEDGLPSAATARQKFERWKASLARFTGWQYVLRLTACLAIAEAIQVIWPQHHSYWIGLTVALLTQRQIEALPVRTTQRALGTALGVLLAGLMIAYQPSPAVIVGVVAVIAGIRPLLKAKNYLAYSVIMTPLVIILLDGGQAPQAGLLIDRLGATLAGAALVVAANALVGPLVPKLEPAA